MSSNVGHVGMNQPLVGGGLPSTSARASIDGLSGGSGPSVTLRSPDRPAAGSKPGPLEGIKSLRIGAGIWNDIWSRTPYYASDWIDAWNYRVVPATTLIFFAKYSVSCACKKRPNLRNRLQRPSRDRLLFRSHRDYWKVWCYGGFTFFCNGCWGILGVWWTTVMHSRRYGHVFMCWNADESNILILPPQVLSPF